MRYAVLLVFLVFLPGCTSGPESHIFRLHAVPPLGGFPHVPGDPLVLAAIEIPGTLQRPEKVHRLSGYHVDVGNADRWAATLAPVIREIFIEDLALRLPRELLYIPEVDEVGPARAVIIRIHDFAVWPDGRVMLDVMWVVLGSQNRDGVLRRRQLIEVRTSRTDAFGQADGMSRALGELADRIVAALADYS